MEYMGYELTPELSEEAYQSDKAELLEAFDPQYVTIDELNPPAGYLGLLRVTVLHPTYILTSATDTDPKPVDELSFTVAVPNFYPAIAPTLYFASDCRLAHINTYRNGVQCIDKWRSYTSLKIAVEKTVRAILYDEETARYDSPACSSIEEWQQGMAAKGAFPLLNPPDLILRSPTEADAPVTTAPIRTAPTTPTPPPLPGMHSVSVPSGPPPLPGGF